ncbi:MAG TPA: hypothetical protein VGI40_07660 [Pirellulaceae bacterium]|jgi:hypothetical protein
MKQTKPKMGRPPKPPDERMDATVRIRFTEAERADLERAAGDADLSNWARRVLLRAAKRR